MRHGRETGSILIEIVLVVLVLAGVGYTIYRTGQARQVVPSQVTSTHKSHPTAGTQLQPQPASDALAAKMQVQALYYSWLADSRGTNFSIDIDSWRSQGLITAGEAAYLKAPAEYDKITCSQNPLTFDEYAFSDPVVNQDTATMTVTGAYASNTTTTITVALERVSDKWAVASITCPET